jgi:hypothetical protein
MIDKIQWGYLEFKVPEGYEAISPENFDDDEDIYIVGTINGKPRAYGPFSLYDVSKKELKHRVTEKIFTDLASHWLRKIR